MTGFVEAISGARLLFDGSMGALLSSMGHMSDCPELLCVEKPDIIYGIHRSYIDAGAQVIITNSLGANPIKLRHAGLSGRAAELARASVEVARRAAGSDALVAFDVGTSGEFLRPVGAISFDELVGCYTAPIAAAAGAGADLILLETITDIAEARAIITAARGAGVPVACSYTFEPGLRTLTGGAPEAAALCAAALGASAIGINCSFAPDKMLAPLAAMRGVCDLPVIVQPNAGLPGVDAGGTAVYSYTAEMMLPSMKDIVDAGASAIGGCCGTTPDYIRRFSTLDLSGAPSPAWDGRARICSTREVVEAAAAADGAARIDDVDDVFDLDPEDCAAIVDLSGLSPDEAAELVMELQSMSSKPLIFEGGEDEAVSAACRVYAGVAGIMECESAAAVREYGAVIL